MVGFRRGSGKNHGEVVVVGGGHGAIDHFKPAAGGWAARAVAGPNDPQKRNSGNRLIAQIRHRIDLH